MASTILFCLDVRADYSPEERTNINRYKLGSQVIYNSRAAQRHFETANAHLDQSQQGTTGQRFAGLARGAFSMALANMQLNISIASLGRGHHIECKELDELLESEDTIRNACKNLTRYLDVASTFDGSEIVVEYVNGEEQVHVAQNAPPLLEYAPSTPAAAEPSTPPPEISFGIPPEIGQFAKKLMGMARENWLSVETKVIAYAKTRGWNITELHVRLAGGCLGILIFILFLQIV